MKKMDIQVIEDGVSLPSIVELPFFLSVAASFLTWSDLHNLQAVNRSCRNRVSTWIGTWPDDMRDFLQTLRITKTSKILILGCHFTKLGPISDSLRTHPPILNFALGSLAFDPLRDQLFGMPWSEYVISNQQPLGLGRGAPCVCPANDHGTTIFYCGGMYTSTSDDTTARPWTGRNDFLRTVSSSTALFDVQAASWISLPPMPEGVCNAGVCRIGTKIYIIGGEVMDPNDNSRMVGRHSVLCFDLEQKQWMTDSGIPDYPGMAYGGLAVIKLDESTIMVAGGCFEPTDQNIPGIPGFKLASREAFSFDLASLTWNALPLLPEIPDASSTRKFSGFVYLENGNEKTFAVNCLTQSFYLSNGQWVTLSDMRGPGTFLTMPNCLTGIGDGEVAISFGCIGNEVFIARQNTWRELFEQAPPQCFGVKLLDATGGSMRVSLSYNDRAVAVSIP